VNGGPSCRLGNAGIATVLLGQSPPSSEYNVQGRGLPFFQGKADFGLLHPTPRVWCEVGTQRAKRGDVLVSVRAPVGDVNVAEDDCVIGRGIAAIRAGHDLDPWFLFFALQHVRPVLKSRATGSTFESVNRETLLALQLPFPSLDEQRAIAKQLRLVSRNVSHQNQSFAIMERVKGAATRELFTRGLRGERQKETEMGPVPNSWNVVRLGSLGRIGNGSTPKISVPEYWDGGTFPWLTSAKVYDREITSAARYVTQKALTECHLPRVQPGAVVLAITGQGKTLGHCAVLRIEATISQHLAYVSIDPKKADPSFVRGYLETQYSYLRQIASGGGSTKGALTCGFLRELPIPLPPTVDEQNSVAAICAAIDRKIDLHKRKTVVLKELFKTLLNKFMTGEICVSDLNPYIINDSEPGTEATA